MFTILHQYAIEEFTNHINPLDPHIKFTIEEEQDGQLPFLDSCYCIIVNRDGCLKAKICKPTHTDQYLNWDSNHHLEYKRSVVCTLLRRAETVVSESSDREEVKHVKKTLTANGYKKWGLEIPKKREKVEVPSKDRTTARKHPLHYWCIWTTPMGVRIPQSPLAPQTFQHSRAPVVKPHG